MNLHLQHEIIIIIINTVEPLLSEQLCFRKLVACLDIDYRVEGLEAAHAITLHPIQYIRVLRKNHFLSAQSIATVQLRQRPVFSHFCTWTGVSTARFGLVRGCVVGERIAVLGYRINFGASGPYSGN